MDDQTFRSLSFLAPRPRRLSKTGCPGTQIKICIAKKATTFARGCLEVSSLKFCLMLCVHCKKCSQTCLRHKRLLVEQTGEKFAHLFECQKQSDLKIESVVFEVPRYVSLHVNLSLMKAFLLLLLITFKNG